MIFFLCGISFVRVVPKTPGVFHGQRTQQPPVHPCGTVPPSLPPPESVSGIRQWQCPRGERIRSFVSERVYTSSKKSTGSTSHRTEFDRPEGFTDHHSSDSLSVHRHLQVLERIWHDPCQGRYFVKLATCVCVCSLQRYCFRPSS